MPKTPTITRKTIIRTTIRGTGEPYVKVKIPKGYRFAGRWGRAVSEDDSTFTVHVREAESRGVYRNHQPALITVNKTDLTA